MYYSCSNKTFTINKEMNEAEVTNQINLVLFPFAAKNLTMGKTKNGAWFFVFDFSEKDTISLISLIENYFKSFEDVSLNSQIYAMTSDNVIFEVYRKMPTMSLTISLLCNLTDKIWYLNKNDLWMRRKDLSGVHFKIGYFPDLSFCFEINQVFFS